MSETESGNRQPGVGLTDPDDRSPRLVVGLGASAGGLEALERFFDAMPVDSGMAFVVVQHLSRDHKSLMDELLARHTAMRIVRVEKRVRVERDTIYLLTPGTELQMDGEYVEPIASAGGAGFTTPISAFFRSLAVSHGPRAAGIVLSGTGSDGSSALGDLHDAGCLILVQSTATAKFDGMPRAAIATSLADVVLPPEEMSAALLARVEHAELPLPSPSRDGQPLTGLSRLVERLHEVYDLDFSQYKPATIARRVERRVSIHHAMSVEDYCARAVGDAIELDALYRDLLIGVTRFFRDPEAFAILEREVIGQLVDSTSHLSDVRVWVAGCATGEEAYSIGVLFLEAFDARQRTPNVKIFATDMHRGSLEVAAAGIYPRAAIANLNDDRRERFFLEEPHDQVRVDPRLRKLVVFSVHNLIKDPPFSRIDLVSCRNLLIYFQPSAQRRALAGFHFALRPKGVLMLGPSETTGEVAEEFGVIDRHWNVFRKIGDRRLPLDLKLDPTHPARAPRQAEPRLGRAYEMLLQRFVPTGVLINERREALHFFGDADRYFRPSAGRASGDLVAMARGDLRIALSSAITTALKTGEKASFRGVRLDEDHILEVSAEPFVDKITGASFVMVLLDVGATRSAGPSSPTFDAEDESRARIRQLEQELANSDESLRAAIEQLEAANEELQAGNEELVASNEELQATNEELHSVNEELFTVNAEYEQKIHELDLARTDLDNLIRASEIGTIFTDANLRVRFFTPQASEIFNLMPQDVGRDLRHISTRVTGDSDLLGDLTQVVESREPHEAIVTLLDGRRFLRRVKVYMGGGSETLGVVHTFVDVTRLHAIEEALRESQSQLRVMIDNAPLGVLAVDEAGSITHANPVASSLFGYPHEQLVGMRVDELVPVEDRALHSMQRHSYLRDASSRPMGTTRSLTALAAGGRRVPVEIRLSPATVNGRRQTIAFITDIRDQVEATARLVESERRFRLMADEAPVAIWLSDATGARTFFNPAWLAITGRPLEREVGERWTDGLHPDDRPAYLAAYRASVVERRPLEIEFRLQRADGSHAWLSERARPRFDSDGTFLGAIGCCVDVTTEKELREEQRRIERKVQETAKLESLGILAGGIAHDFNNILTGILGYASSERLELPVGSPQATVFDHIEEAAQRAAELCRQMLAYSGRGRFVVEHVDLSGIARETVDLLRISVGKHATLNLDLSSGLPAIEADAAQVRQILMNLVINAAEAIGPRSGEIVVRTSVRELDSRAIGQLDVQVGEELKPGRYVELEVADDGAGISPEHLRRIFDPFFTTKFTGRGLGLAAVLGIVRSHNGALAVTSTVGKGTRFRLLLPAAGVMAPSAPGRVRRSEPFRASGDVLVVDDEKWILGTAEHMLGKVGFTVHGAGNGEHALELMRQAPGRFRFVLLDLTMPRMSGAETLAELRAIDPGVKVVLMSGYTEAEATEMLKGLAIDGFLAKPFSADALIEQARRLIAPGA